MAITKTQRRLRIKRGIRKKISGTAQRPRLAIYRSNTAIYCQLIDDENARTLATADSRKLSQGRALNAGVAKQVGQAIAEAAKAAGIETVIFDRAGYRYHGKVKALAEAAREGGLKF